MGKIKMKMDDWEYRGRNIECKNAGEERQSPNEQYLIKNNQGVDQLW